MPSKQNSYHDMQVFEPSIDQQKKSAEELTKSLTGSEKLGNTVLKG